MESAHVEYPIGRAAATEYTAEQHKLIAETGKMRVERWLTPVLVVFGSIGSLIGGWSAVSALLHIAGLDK
jgi:hypothetical protein